MTTRDKLIELRRLLTLEPGTFAFHCLPGTVEPPLPTSEAEVNAFIAERTRVWRESWILPALDELITAERRP